MDYSYDSAPSPPKDSANANGKQQATFLTKLYALLERPENHHMIRWDADGEHIIVERPEQLALHVLPSIYRQSRFASFSRQLNVRVIVALFGVDIQLTVCFVRSTASCAK